MNKKISKNQWFLFMSLYTTQYVGLGFMMVSLVGILRQRGAALNDLSIVYFVGLPWILKFLWAPLIDRFGLKKWGHYRGWLLVFQLLMILALLALSQLSLDNHFEWVIIIGVLFATLSASQDIAVDALASREFSREQRGIANGIQMSGGLLGNVIGGGLVLLLYPYIGWAGAFYLMAAVTSVSWFQLLFFRESNLMSAKESPSAAETFKHLMKFWRGKGIWFLFVFISSMGFSLVYGVLTPLMMDSGKTLAEAGLAMNIFGTTTGVFSALLAGWLIQKIGRKLALMYFFLLQVICFITMLPVTFIVNNLTLYAILMIYFFIYPLIATIMATLMMDYAAQSVAPGTDYTVQYTVSMISGMLMASLSLQIAHYFGYFGVFIVAIGIALTALALALLYAKKLPAHIHIAHE